jgi:predicted GNAT family N-acyltransferase
LTGVAAHAYRSVPLAESHDVSRFSCGVEELDDWLRNNATHAAAMNTARTFVWAEADGVVVAYYSLAGHQVVREEMPHRLARGSPNQIPSVLIGKLALGRTLQGGELGASLLVDALSRVLVATQQVAARLVVVDAINERAVGYYEHFGFLRTAPDNFRLLRKVSDIAADFSAP